jgi:hypothetical protein
MTVNDVKPGDIISFWTDGGCSGKSYYDDVKVLELNPKSYEGYIRVKKSSGATPLIYTGDVKGFKMVKAYAPPTPAEHLGEMAEKLSEITSQTTALTKNVSGMSESMSQFAFNLGQQQATILTAIEELKKEIKTLQEEKTSIF